MVNDNELYHHGVLGMKWGVRNAETKARYARIKKGTPLYRASWSKEDKTYNNRKYVSTTKEDNDYWKEQKRQDFLEGYNIEYLTTKDLKLASPELATNIFVKNFLENKKLRDTTLKEVDELYKKYDEKDRNPSVMIGWLMANSKHGPIAQAYVKKVMSKKISALPNLLSPDLTTDAIIVLDPDKNLRKNKITTISPRAERGIYNEKTGEYVFSKVPEREIAKYDQKAKRLVFKE